MQSHQSILSNQKRQRFSLNTWDAGLLPLFLASIRYIYLEKAGKKKHILWRFFPLPDISLSLSLYMVANGF